MDKLVKDYWATIRPGVIRLFTGRMVNVFRLKEYEIDIKDIAHALSNECRYSGHCRRFYSVAQHSVLVSYNCHPGHAMAGLLHDADEAYFKDIPAPIKHKWWMWFYRRAGNRAIRKIYERFEVGLSKIPDDVKRADKLVFAAERIRLFDSVEDKTNGLIVKGFENFEPWSPARAEHEFKRRFAELTYDKAFESSVVVFSPQKDGRVRLYDGKWSG